MALILRSLNYLFSIIMTSFCWRERHLLWPRPVRAGLSNWSTRTSTVCWSPQPSPGSNQPTSAALWFAVAFFGPLGLPFGTCWRQERPLEPPKTEHSLAVFLQLPRDPSMPTTEHAQALRSAMPAADSIGLATSAMRLHCGSSAWAHSRSRSSRWSLSARCSPSLYHSACARACRCSFEERRFLSLWRSASATKSEALHYLITWAASGFCQRRPPCSLTSSPFLWARLAPLLVRPVRRSPFSLTFCWPCRHLPSSPFSGFNVWSLSCRLLWCSLPFPPEYPVSLESALGPLCLQVVVPLLVVLELWLDKPSLALRLAWAHCSQKLVNFPCLSFASILSFSYPFLVPLLLE